MSRRFGTLKESFDRASGSTDRVPFAKFKQFIEEIDALRGFNITVPLLQQLFSELDPHKKTFLNFKDWQNAFAAFNEGGMLITELKNYLQCQFTDVKSAFGYL